MIVRFIINNVYSFGEMREFNMLPKPRYSRLAHHKYTINDFGLLKMGAIYGPNGSGKSNLIKALSLLQKIVIEGHLGINLENTAFKLYNQETPPQLFAIEFFQENKAFYYGIEIMHNTIISEELYESGLGIKQDKTIFERKTEVETGKTSITFLSDFENDAESKVLKSIIEKNLIKPDKLLLTFLPTLESPFLTEVAKAILWFRNTLQIIYPDSKPSMLAHHMHTDKELERFAQDIMGSFHIGVSKVQVLVEKVVLKDYITPESALKRAMEQIEDSPNKMVEYGSADGKKRVVLAKYKDEYYTKTIFLAHQTENGESKNFDLKEESDGTVRLLDLIPVFKDIISQPKVYLIDEVERSMHPLFIKELITKFSLDDNTFGQLIFTTHEAQLLDQDILRQDEIWFTEKNKKGCTEIYSLSDFKEHSTIDIRKGYLQGRYGAIPFLGNLQGLNWHKYDTQKETV